MSIEGFTSGRQGECEKCGRDDQLINAGTCRACYPRMTTPTANAARKDSA